MKVYRGIDEIPFAARSVVTVGTFDGVHYGHQAIMGLLRQRAAEINARSVVVTFDPHPREVVRSERVPLLTTTEERIELIGKQNIDSLLVIPFTPEFALLDPAEFVEEVLVRRIGLREMVVGHDHSFGYKRKGSAELLARLGAQHGFSVEVVPAFEAGADIVSSTAIRLALEEGDVGRAARMLGRPYEIRGTVTTGDARGRTIGFPTANIAGVHPSKIVPRNGVYAVRAMATGFPGPLSGMMNIGSRPTFDGRDLRMEVHFFDFDGDLYGASLGIQFIEWLREEQKFDSVEALIRQLNEDRARCIPILFAVP